MRILLVISTVISVVLIATLNLWAQTTAKEVPTANILSKAVEAYNADELHEAAKLFYETKMTDPQVANRAQAEYYLGQSLYKLGMYQSALAYFNAVFLAGPAHPYYLKGAEGLVNVAVALKDDTLIPSQLNKFYNNQEFARLDPMVLSRINFYVGLLLYRQEKFAESIAFLGAIDKKSDVHAKALFLEAVIHIKMGAKYNLARDEARTQAEYNQAIGLFKKVLDLSGGQKKKAELALATYENIQRLWQLSALNLARAYYGKGDYAKAVKYFARIPRYSSDWADALFEISWAHFMREDYGKALGALHSLHAPRFANAFVPESLILKATIYFHVCLYEEAKQTLAEFHATYEKNIPLLKSLIESNPANESYSTLLLKDKLDTKDPMAKVPTVVRTAVLQSPRVENFRHFLRSLEAEEQAIKAVEEWKGNRLAQELIGVVAAQRNLLKKTAGGFVKVHLKNIMQTIQGFVGHAKMIKLEVTNRERQLLKAGLSLKAEQRGKLAPRPGVSDETFNYWPHKQEYWQDELGYYEYTVRRACPAQR
jgi:tetratricopeptide (TPR) repeat protein